MDRDGGIRHLDDLQVMSAKKLLEANREAILRLAAQHGARNVRVFGSAARGETGAGSDIDLLVDMEERRSLLDLVGFWQDVESLLGCPVDVVTDGGVSPHLRDCILLRSRSPVRAGLSHLCPVLAAV